MDSDNDDAFEKAFERFDEWYEIYYLWGESPEEPIRNYSDTNNKNNGR